MDLMEWFDSVDEHPFPKGFVLLVPRILDIDFDHLREAISWEQKEIPDFFGHGPTPIPRLTAMYGSEYRYSGIYHPPRPLPPILNAIRRQVESHTSLTAFNSVLCNLYRTGRDSIGWHSDDDYNATRAEIASLSFGATRRFKIRLKADHKVQHAMDLHHGSILLMSGRAQLDWQHSIPKTAKPVDPRINLTFRCME